MNELTIPKQAYRPITFAEAIEFNKVEDANFFPVACINDTGEKSIAEFVEFYAKSPGNNVLAIWNNEAEVEALNLLSGYDAIIEMRGFDAKSSNPVVLRLYAEDFDWSIEVKTN